MDKVSQNQDRILKEKDDLILKLQVEHSIKDRMITALKKMRKPN